MINASDSNTLSQIADSTSTQKANIEILKMPLSFAMVREDSRQDLEIIKKYFPDEKISMLMVSSGGCTAALLAALAPLNDLTLIDPNHPQLELTRLKLKLLSVTREERMKVLGHKEMDPKERKKKLEELMKDLNINENIFGDLDQVSKLGPDHMGSYENVFEDLRKNLSAHSKDLETLFELDDIEKQKEFIDPKSEFGKALDIALDMSMSQENLCYLFGEKATANRVQEFSRHFAERIRKYVSTHKASQSPWLANMILGKFFKDQAVPWLDVEPTETLPKITYVKSLMNDLLGVTAPETYHVIHLSNIIDWLTYEEANFTLEAAYKALKPGGIVTIRQLNSNIDIPKASNLFNWDLKTSNEYLYNDHSFFYRNFFIGVKPK